MIGPGVRRTAVFALILAIMQGCAAANGLGGAHPYRLDEPATRPRLFAEGVVSTGEFDSHPAFMPDGNTLYFVRSTPDFEFWTIVVTHYIDGAWTTPDIAPFSGRYADADPFITADGRSFYFISDRPAPGRAERNLDIWRMQRTASGWGEPKNLGAPVNSPGSEWYPTVDRNGTLYFGSDRPGGEGLTDLYRAARVNGNYPQVENLGSTINTAHHEYEPLIAPDGSFLIFMTTGRPDGHGGNDLYLSHERDGRWSSPQNLGGDINSVAGEYSPALSPDGQYFFWTSKRNLLPRANPRQMSLAEYQRRLHSAGNGLGDIYQVGISALPLDP